MLLICLGGTFLWQQIKVNVEKPFFDISINKQNKYTLPSIKCTDFVENQLYIGRIRLEIKLGVHEKYLVKILKNEIVKISPV